MKTKIENIKCSHCDKVFNKKDINESMCFFCVCGNELGRQERDKKLKTDVIYQ